MRQALLRGLPWKCEGRPSWSNVSGGLRSVLFMTSAPVTVDVVAAALSATQALVEEDWSARAQAVVITTSSPPCHTTPRPTTQSCARQPSVSCWRAQRTWTRPTWPTAGAEPPTHALPRPRVHRHPAPHTTLGSRRTSRLKPGLHGISPRRSPHRCPWHAAASGRAAQHNDHGRRPSRETGSFSPVDSRRWIFRSLGSGPSLNGCSGERPSCSLSPTARRKASHAER